MASETSSPKSPTEVPEQWAEELAKARFGHDNDWADVGGERREGMLERARLDLLVLTPILPVLSQHYEQQIEAHQERAEQAEAALKDCKELVREGRDAISGLDKDMWPSREAHEAARARARDWVEEASALQATPLPGGDGGEKWRDEVVRWSRSLADHAEKMVGRCEEAGPDGDNKMFHLAWSEAARIYNDVIAKVNSLGGKKQPQPEQVEQCDGSGSFLRWLTDEIAALERIDLTEIGIGDGWLEAYRLAMREAERFGLRCQPGGGEESGVGAGASPTAPGVDRPGPVGASSADPAPDPKGGDAHAGSSAIRRNQSIQVAEPGADQVECCGKASETGDCCGEPIPADHHGSGPAVSETGSSKHWPRATMRLLLPLYRNGATPLHAEGGEIGYRSGSEESADGKEIELWFALDPRHFTVDPQPRYTLEEIRERLLLVDSFWPEQVTARTKDQDEWVKRRAVLDAFPQSTQKGAPKPSEINASDLTRWILDALERPADDPDDKESAYMQKRIQAAIEAWFAPHEEAADEA